MNRSIDYQGHHIEIYYDANESGYVISQYGETIGSCLGFPGPDIHANGLLKHAQGTIDGITAKKYLQNLNRERKKFFNI